MIQVKYRVREKGQLERANPNPSINPCLIFQKTAYIIETVQLLKVRDRITFVSNHLLSRSPLPPVQIPQATTHPS